MQELFHPTMRSTELSAISALGLAHMGDCVFELLVRTRLCAEGHLAAGELHKLTVAQVKAPAQAKVMERLLPRLTEEELALYKRARNTHVHGVPQGAKVGEYHAATGLEALFGWLYLLGRAERVQELFAAAMEE